MRKTLLPLCLSVFTLFNSYSQPSLTLNDSLTQRCSSQTENVCTGTKTYSSTNGFNLRINASRTVSSNTVQERKLEYIISDPSTKTEISLLDRDANGLSIGDDLTFDYKSGTNHLRINMSYPKRFQIMTSAEVFQNGSAVPVSRYYVGTERKSKLFIISALCDWINRRVVEPKLEEFCEKGNEIYFDAVSDVLEGRFPEGLPYDSLRSGIYQADVVSRKADPSEKARKATGVLFDELAKGFNKKTLEEQNQRLEIAKER